MRVCDAHLPQTTKMIFDVFHYHILVSLSPSIQLVCSAWVTFDCAGLGCLQ